MIKKSILLGLGFLFTLVIIGCSSEDSITESINNLNKKIQGKWILTSYSGGITGAEKTPVEDQKVIEFTTDAIYNVYDFEEETGILIYEYGSPYDIIHKVSDINNESYFFLVLAIQSSFSDTTIDLYEGELILGHDVVDGVTHYFVPFQ